MTYTTIAIALLTVLLHPCDCTPINLQWYAPFLAGGGFSSEALAFASGFVLQPTTTNVEFHSVNFAEPATYPKPHMHPNVAATFTSKPYKHPNAPLIVVCHSTPDAWYPSRFPGWDTIAPCPPPSIPSRLKIGRAMYETDNVPSDWREKLLSMDYIWVPSQFNVDTFAKVIPRNRIAIVPEPVDTEFWSPKWCQPRKSTPFVFFANGKWETRKNWDMLLMAFLQEFKHELQQSSDEVRLVIKTSPFHLPHGTTPQSLAEGKFPQLITLRDKVKIIDEMIAVEQVREIMCDANALVSSSYGEGWGRPYVEAMSMGMPVIATYWSGNTAFMDESVAFPVKYDKLVPVPGLDGHSWALVNITDLQAQLRFVFTHRQEAKRVGERARQAMIDKYSPQAVARIVENTIMGHLQLGPQHQQHNDEL